MYRTMTYGIDYWTCKRYFGEEWGENDYCRVKRDVSKQFYLSLCTNI